MVIMGAAGSGKGTISSRIVTDFGLKHFSSGDILRSQILQKTALGQKAQAHMAAGGLVPDEVMVGLVARQVGTEASMFGSTTAGWLLDGFPRTVPQAKALHALHKVDLVVSLDVPFATIIERIAGRWVHPGSGRVYNTDFNPPKVPGFDDETGEALVQREDDTPAAVEKRLQTYENTSKPLRDFYSELGVLRVFQGTESNVIWPEVRKELKGFINVV